MITVMAIHFNSFNNFEAMLTMLYWFSVRKIDSFNESSFPSEQKLVVEHV